MVRLGGAFKQILPVDHPRKSIYAGFFPGYNCGPWADPIQDKGGTSVASPFRRLMHGMAFALIFAAVSAAAPLKVGDKAPDFTLPDQNGNKVKLSDYLGKKNVVLAFYVLAFTGG